MVVRQRLRSGRRGGGSDRTGFGLSALWQPGAKGSQVRGFDSYSVDICAPIAADRDETKTCLLEELARSVAECRRTRVANDM